MITKNHKAITTIILLTIGPISAYLYWQLITLRTRRLNIKRRMET